MDLRLLVVVPALLALAGCKSTCGDCDDGIDCTADSCDMQANTCRHTPADYLCPGGEQCDPKAGCVPGSEPLCENCTSDCISDAECNAPPCVTDAQCEDGTCVGGTNTCECDTDADCHVYDDGDRCNGVPTCVEHRCQADGLPPVVCEDPALCHTNSCEPATGECLTAAVANGTSCATTSCIASTCQDGVCVDVAELCCEDGADNDDDGQTDCDDPDCSCPDGCTHVPTPEPPGMSPLSAEVPPGRVESVELNVGSWWDPEYFHDDYVYNSADTAKLGTRREWGGVVVFFGMADNAGNTIDANDTGREVQVAFYDADRRRQNCAWNATCESRDTDCLESISFLGWNPVQGGNSCNNGSGTDSVELLDGTATTTVTPLQRNPDWDAHDCRDNGCSDSGLSVRRSQVRVTQVIRFVRANVAELDYTITNLANLDHPVTSHEMPTLYAANGNGGPDLWRLFNSESTEIPINQMTPGDNGWYFKHFQSPGGWATLQNDNLDYGVGLLSESRPTGFTGFQDRGLPFNNFRPHISFAIPAYGEVRARAYLLLGSLATVRAEAQWLDSHLAPFGWLDEPPPDAVVGEQVQLGGWALDNRAVSAVRARIDGVDAGGLSFGGSRGDVCRVWAGYDGCGSSGFSGTIDTSGLSECPHLLEIVARDNDNNERVIARTRIYRGAN